MREKNFSSGTRVRNPRLSITDTSWNPTVKMTCRVFRREFMQIGHIEVFVESITIASACKKVLRKRFLKPDTIGLIPTGGYTCNNRYSKKALMWLLHMEETDGVQIMHCRNGREYRLPELPNFSVDGYCHETNTIYAFFGCFGTGIDANRSGMSPH